MPESNHQNSYMPLRDDGAFLRRPRIEGLLQKALTRPIVTVIAGPGCGKTDALYSFLQGSGMCVLWFQLGETDNQHARFWEKFTNVVALRNAPLAASLAKLELPSDESRFERFLELWTDEIKPRFHYSFVFDDLHLIRNMSVRWFIRMLSERMWPNNLDRSQPGNTTVLLSREDCGLDTVKLSSQGKLAVIGEAELRFTKSETLELFRFLGVPVSRELQSSMDEIYAETEGWAFITDIAGRLLETRADGLKYIKTALRRNVSLVIENELFAKNSPEMNLFLIRLSLIEHLSADLIALLKNGESLIREAVRLSSFIRYDSYTDVYYMHHLLQDFLRQKQELLSKEEQQELYQTAAEWCAAHAYNMDAAAYFVKAGDYASMIGLVYTQPQIIPLDNAVLLLDLIKTAPEKLEETIPWICIPRARLLLSLGEFEQAKSELQETILRWEGEKPSREAAFILLGAYYTLGFSHMLSCIETGDYDFAKYFAKADSYLEASGFKPSGTMRVATVAPYIIGIGSKEKGEPQKFIQTLEDMTPHTMHIMDGCMAGMDDLARAELAYYQCEIPACRRYAAQALFTATEHEQFEISNRARFYLIKAGLAEGKYKPIKETLLHMEEQIGNPSFLNRYIRFDIQTGWFYGSIGQKERIVDWLKSDVPITRSETVVSTYEDFARCKYYLMEKKYHEMLAMCSSRTGHFDIGRYLFGQIGLAVHRAVALYNLGDSNGAAEALREGYELAAPNGLDMIFIELGNHMRTMIAGLLKTDVYDISKEWLERIQTKSATYAKRVSQVRAQYLTEEGLDGQVTLTPKEMDILIDLSHGLSRTEIAEERSVSVNTVKMMFQYIYEKLGAENSVDVVRIAFSKGLL
jgi:LuxR family maltose regulon positive regulatory protein